MQELLPKDALGPAIGAGGAAVAYLAWRMILDTVKLRIDSRKTTDEAQTARLLGDKAMAEARSAGVTELASIVAANSTFIKQLRAELDAEKVVSRRFHSAVLEFIGVVSQQLPDMPEMARARIEAALDRLRAASVWIGF